MRLSGVLKVLGVFWVIALIGAVITISKLKQHRERIDQGKPVGEMMPIISSDNDSAVREDANTAPTANTHTPQPH